LIIENNLKDKYFSFFSVYTSLCT